MPIVDGLTATKRIRSFEHSRTESHLSPRAAINGRVPIFAVSASLLERERQTYIDAGFDGWVLKPIDFKRLEVLMTGIVDESVRNVCLYTSGEWEVGGWFRSRQQAVYEANVSNPPKRPAAPKRTRSQTSQSDGTRQGLQSSDSGSNTPTPSRSGKKKSDNYRNIPSMSSDDERSDYSEPMPIPPTRNPEEKGTAQSSQP